MSKDYMPYEFGPFDGPSDCEFRDNVAAMALQTILAESIGSLSIQYMAEWSYDVADAMMKARARRRRNDF